MEKKGFTGRLKILSKPTGKPMWSQAAKSIILMILAALIAKFLGFDEGIKAVMFITLIATIIIDLPLPLHKIIPMALVGFIMTFLAFISSSLALSSLPVFLCFTVIWAFLSLSMYIFSESVGLFGFIIFCGYFLSVALVNRDASTLDWGLYIILAYLVASILFIPKIWGRKKDILNRVASPFVPETSLERVLSVRETLSGIPLDTRDYELFRIGNYLTGFRGYSKLILSRLSGESHELFHSFINTADESSLQIAKNITTAPNPVGLESVDQGIKNMEKSCNSTDPNTKTLVDASKNIKALLQRANDLLVGKYPSTGKLKILSPRSSLKDVLKANFNLKNMYIRHALRFSLALTLGLLVVYLTHGRDALWVTMGILIIIKPDVTSTLNNIILRVSFNVVAIILAIILGFLFPHYALVWLGFLMLFLFRAFYPSYMGLSVMFLSIFVVLIWPTGPVWENAIARIIDISIGAIIAFICAYLILPSRMTVDLPGQIAQIIHANREYAKAVIPDEERDYNHENAVAHFRKYMLEEKNLESAIKKVDDTFNDIGDDVSLYKELGAANRKLAADISALATLIESEGPLPDVSRFKEQLIDALNELALSVDKNVVLPRANIDTIYLGSDVAEISTLESYLDWISNDVKFMQEGVELGHQTGSLKRYRDMT
ncbi:MAG: putative membrane protein [Methanobacterium sp. Maddingley MBC34]|nr:MAG: putative membrane protein [Methanobacterium sp. Maddingley MBC34]